MSETLNELILSTQPAFQELDAANGNLLDFKQQCMFAKQQITKNDYTTNIAANSPGSLKNAICNVAAIGISLNPALQHAYLVPRDNRICLDISYRGLVKLATDCGAILWAKTELVYANDEFVWNGVSKEPTHKANPFGDRGDVIGGYCLAKLPDGSVMVETMTRAEMDKIQATSTAKNGPWKTWPDEMRKKSVTKRASKSWPQTGNRVRVDKAIEVLNEHEGDASIQSHVAPEDVALVATYTEEEKTEYQRCIDESDFVSLFALVRSLDIEAQKDLHNLCVPKAEHGKKGATKKQLQANIDEGERILESWLCIVRENIDSGDDAGVYEVMDGLSEWAENWILDRLTPEQIRAYKQILEAA